MSSFELKRTDSGRTGGYGLLRNQSKKTSWEDTITGPNAPEMGQMQDCLLSTARRLDALLSIEEPPRTGWLASLVEGASFQTFFTLVIAANVLYMIITVNNDMERLSHSKPTAQYPKIDMCFLVLYCAELACKLAVHGVFFFWNEDMSWNIMDFMLVLYSLIDSIAASQSPGGRAKGPTWVRTLRIFRVAKVLRILKFVQAFKQLHVIMTAIVQSALALFWILMIFAIIFMIFSLYFVSSTATYLESVESVEDLDMEGLVREFGSVQRCVLTLFMTLTGGGDWGDIHSLLLPVGMASTVFIFYVCLSQLALINIVTGIFCDNAMKLSEPDVTQKADDQFENDKELAKALLKLFLTVDHEDDGLLNKGEFQEMLESGRLANFLMYLGIDPLWSETHLPMLFDRIVEVKGISPDRAGVTWVDASILVETCMSLRGNARSTELVDLRAAILQIHGTQEALCEHLGITKVRLHSKECQSDDDAYR
jgi:hypothetical protein